MSFDDDAAFPFKKSGNDNGQINNADNKPGPDKVGESATRFTFRQVAEIKDAEVKAPEPENSEAKRPADKAPEASKTEAKPAEHKVSVMKSPANAVHNSQPKISAPASERDAHNGKPQGSASKHEPAGKNAAQAPMTEPRLREPEAKRKRKKEYSPDFYEHTRVAEVPVTKKTGKSKGLIAFVALVTTLAVAYVVMAVFFRSHIMFRTTVDGVECSFKSIAEVENLLMSEVDDYELNIKTIEGIFYKVTASDIDLKCDMGSELRSLCESQPIFAWPVTLFKDTDVSLALKLEYDSEKLSRKLDSFGFLNPEKMTAPKEARLVGYTASRGFEVQDSVYGNTINESVFTTQLRHVILSLGKDLDLKESNCYVQPLYTEDSDDFQLLKKQAEKCVGSTVTYTFGGMNETLESKEFLPWLTLDDNKELTLDDNSLLEYVQGIATKYTSTNDTRPFKTTYGEVVDVPSRTYGFTVDVDAETKKLKEDILSGGSVSRAPSFVDSSGNGVKDFGNSYVEINLGMQHLFLYVDGEKVYECDIVSGKPSTGAATPAGIYAIYYCKRDAILRGPGYASPVSYWMPFNGGIGIHDATWQPRFGYDRYLRNGSHGCINVSLDSAKTIFGYVSAGFPVILYHYGTATPEPGAAYTPPSEEPVSEQPATQLPEQGNMTDQDYYTMLQLQNQIVVE